MNRAGAGHEWFARTLDLLRPQIRLLADFSSWSRPFFSDEFAIDPAAKAKFSKDEKVAGPLAKLADALAALPESNHDACDHAARKAPEEGGVKAGLPINATRVDSRAPPLFDTMVVLGLERVVRRLRAALAEWN